MSNLRRMAKPAYIALILLFCAVSGQAQTVAPIQGLGNAQFFDNNGQLLTAGVLYSYQAGTSTQQATYTDGTGLIQNPNPIPFGSGARVQIWLTIGSYYKFVLCLQNDGPACAAGDVLYTVDNVPGGNAPTSGSPFVGIFVSSSAGTATSGVLRLASADQICWRNAAGTANLCLSKNSSDLLTWPGAFTLSGQIVSTVPTGTAPFSIASTTVVPNLNVSQLLGCTWAVPCPIGSTTPNTGAFTTLAAGASLQIGGGTVQVGTQGTDTKLLTAGTISGTAAPLCTDANSGATTSGCPGAFTKMEEFTVCASGCNVAHTPCTISSGASYDVCNDTITLPSAMADANYIPSCVGSLTTTHASTGNGSTNFSLTGFLQQGVGSITAASFVWVTQNQRTNTAGFDSFYCIVIHP